MDIGIISMRYAKALLAYAMEKGVEDELYVEFTTLVYSFYKQPELKNALANPILPPKEKLKLISIAADGDKGSTEEFIRFIRLVLKQRRENYLQFMSLTFLDLYRKAKHIGVGRLITAVPVGSELEERIRGIAAKYLHAQMELETVVDPSIEGGFIFDVDTYRLDASVATQLKRIKHQYIEKNKRIV